MSFDPLCLRLAVSVLAVTISCQAFALKSEDEDDPVLVGSAYAAALGVGLEEEGSSSPDRVVCQKEIDDAARLMFTEDMRDDQKVLITEAVASIPEKKFAAVVAYAPFLLAEVMSTDDRIVLIHILSSIPVEDLETVCDIMDLLDVNEWHKTYVINALCAGQSDQRGALFQWLEGNKTHEIAHEFHPIHQWLVVGVEGRVSDPRAIANYIQNSPYDMVYAIQNFFAAHPHRPLAKAAKGSGAAGSERDSASPTGGSASEAAAAGREAQPPADSADGSARKG